MSCCIVLTRNPVSGTIQALFDIEEGTIKWDNHEQAMKDACVHPIIKKWGGWVVDLDNCAIYSCCAVNTMGMATT